jgi:hypothetical protein
MAITSQERVGKAIHLLRVGLAPIVERELQAAAKAGSVRIDAVQRFADDAGSIVEAPVVRRHLDAEVSPAPGPVPLLEPGSSGATTGGSAPVVAPSRLPRRFQGTLSFDPARQRRGTHIDLARVAKVAAVDRLAPVATRGDVADGAWEVDVLGRGRREERTKDRPGPTYGHLARAPASGVSAFRRPRAPRRRTPRPRHAS